MDFHKVSYAGRLIGYQTSGVDLIYTVKDEGKRKGWFQWMAYVEYKETVAGVDIPRQDRVGCPIYKQGFSTKREAVAYCKAFEAAKQYSYSQRNSEALNVVHDAEMARILGK